MRRLQASLLLTFALVVSGCYITQSLKADCQFGTLFFMIFLTSLFFSLVSIMCKESVICWVLHLISCHIYQDIFIYFDGLVFIMTITQADSLDLQHISVTGDRTNLK